MYKVLFKDGRPFFVLSNKQFEEKLKKGEVRENQTVTESFKIPALSS